MTAIWMKRRFTSKNAAIGIIEIPSRKNRASVPELSQEFRIGEATIRRDLQELEDHGLVLRTYGGVLVMDTGSRESPLKERKTHNREKKERIAQLIAQFIKNRESIMIDGRDYDPANRSNHARSAAAGGHYEPPCDQGAACQQW